jgi:hypothetical protein
MTDPKKVELAAKGRIAKKEIEKMLDDMRKRNSLAKLRKEIKDMSIEAVYKELPDYAARGLLLALRYLLEIDLEEGTKREKMNAAHRFITLMVAPSKLDLSPNKRIKPEKYEFGKKEK